MLVQSWFAARLLLIVGFAATGAQSSFLTDSNNRIPTSYFTMSAPPVSSSYVDPVFSTVSKRLTDATVLATPGIVPEYSQTSSFNLNDTYLVLLWLSGEFHLYDAGGNHIRGLGLMAEPRWSRINANHLYYHVSNRIMRLDVVTNQVVTMVTFPQYGNIDFGRGQGDLSDNERIVVVGDGRYMFIYDLATQTQFIVHDNDQAPVSGKPFDAVTITKDGDSFVVSAYPGWNRGQGIELYDLNGNFVAQLQSASGHFAMGRDVNGTQVMFVSNAAALAPTFPGTTTCDMNGLVKISLDAAATPTCIHNLGWAVPAHYSAGGNDGWVYVSTAEPKAQPVPAAPGNHDQTKWHPFTNEIFRVKADGSVVERIIHHRSTVASYYQEPHANISMSGKMLVYGSDFQVSNPGSYADTYLINMASNTPAGLNTVGLNHEITNRTRGRAGSAR